MPKITFTYKLKQEFTTHPEIIAPIFQKSSPILMLNEPKFIRQKN